MTRSRHNGNFLRTDDKNDGTTSDESDSLFDASDDNTENTDDTEILSEESDNDVDTEALLSDDEGPRPPEYYLAEAESLDVNRLRQQRYSDDTNDRLAWVKEHWNE